MRAPLATSLLSRGIRLMMSCGGTEIALGRLALSGRAVRNTVLRCSAPEVNFPSGPKRRTRQLLKEVNHENRALRPRHGWRTRSL
jgi:hypothetical protein